MAPSIIPECRTSYCLERPCFQMKQIQPGQRFTLDSHIFRDLAQQLYGDSDIERNALKLSTDLTVGVFCVFNLSIHANNPPNIPYIDINKLKRLFFYGEENSSQIDELIDAALVEIKKYPIQLKDLNETNEAVRDIQTDYKASVDVDDKSVYIGSFIDAIETSNASTTIGTLEFLDQMAKYSTTHTICTGDSVTDIDPGYYQLIETIKP